MQEDYVTVSPEERWWGAASHLAAFLSIAVPIPGTGIIGPLAVWLARRDESAFVDDQGRKALNFQITMAVLYLASIPLMLIFVGFLMIFAIALINILFILMAAIRAGSGEAFTYPVTMEFVKARGAIGID